MEKIYSIKNQRLTRFAFTAGLLCTVLAVALSLTAGGAMAADLYATAPPLGAAGSYSVLAATTVTNTGGTTMPGDLGVSPGTAVTGFPPGVVGPPGEIRSTAAAALAQLDADTARLALEAQGPGTTIGSELAGQTLTPGVYTVPGVSLLSGGTLTLNGAGVYIFLTNGLTSTGTVSLINGADACNVFWRDASSVTINGGNFVGTIIALTSISMGTGANLQGRAIAQNGAVTLDTNTFTDAECLTAPIEPTPTPTTTTTPTTTITTTITSTPTTTAPTTTITPTTTAPTTPEPELLPDTGGDLAGTQTPGSQLLRISLGALGIGLVLFGFVLSRNKRKVEK